MELNFFWPVYFCFDLFFVLSKSKTFYFNCSLFTCSLDIIAFVPLLKLNIVFSIVFVDLWGDWPIFLFKSYRTQSERWQVFFCACAKFDGPCFIDSVASFPKIIYFSGLQWKSVSIIKPNFRQNQHSFGKFVKSTHKFKKQLSSGFPG